MICAPLLVCQPLLTGMQPSYKWKLVFPNMQRCWQHYIIHPAVCQSFQFQLFYYIKKRWYIEIIKFHLVDHQ